METPSSHFRWTRDTALADIIGADARASRTYTRNNKNTPSGPAHLTANSRRASITRARVVVDVSRRQGRKHVVKKERGSRFASALYSANNIRRRRANVAFSDSRRKVHIQWEWRKWCPAVWLAWNTCCSSSTWYSRWVTVYVQGEWRRRRQSITLRSLRCIRAAILGVPPRRRRVGRALFRVRISVKLLERHPGIVDPSMLIPTTNFSHRYPFRSWAINHFCLVCKLWYVQL